VRLLAVRWWSKFARGASIAAERDEGFIVLVLSLPLQEVIEAAMVIGGPVAAEFRSVLIDTALPVLLVKETADALEDGVLAVAQNVVAKVGLIPGKAPLSDLELEVEAFGKAGDIAPVHLDPGIRAAVAGTFGTVIVWPFAAAGSEYWKLFFGHRDSLPLL
jgi:hypothetical protein